MRVTILYQFQRITTPSLMFLFGLLTALPVCAAPCAWVVSAETNQTLYTRLQALPAGDCALADQRVDASEIAQVWHKGDKNVILRWTPRACIQGEDGRLAPLDLPGFTRQCPQTARLIENSAQNPDFPAAQKPVPRGVQTVPHTNVSLMTATAALELAAFLGLLAWLALAWRRVLRLPTPLRREELRWWVAGLSVGVLALLLRFAVPPTLSNWYTTVLGPREIPQVDRYGTGHLALQWILRGAAFHGENTLFVTNAVLGALIPPIWLVALRQRALPLRTALLASALLSVLPLHVRLTNSASEHVLAAFAFLAALAAWQAAQRASRRLDVALLGLLAVVLALVTALTRVDAVAPLAAIAGWSLLVDRTVPPLPVTRRMLATLLWLGVLALVLTVVLPLVQAAVLEQGTPIPAAADRAQAMHDFLPGMQRLLFAAPGWIGPIVGLALLAGLVVGLRQEPMLTILAVATFLTIPLGIARSPYDFIMARYYLPVLPMITLLAALGLAPLARRAWVTPLLLIAVVLVARPAWQVKYTFQEEFEWLRGQLAQQPAGCTVAQVAVTRGQTQGNDVDCCLDLPRSPLVAAFPDITFARVDSADDLAALPGACRLYYEGSACALVETAELKSRNATELAWYKTHCADVRHTAGLTQLAETALTPYAHVDAFGGKPVPVRLFRLKPTR